MVFNEEFSGNDITYLLERLGVSGAHLGETALKTKVWISQQRARGEQPLTFNNVARLFIAYLVLRHDNMMENLPQKKTCDEIKARFLDEMVNEAKMILQQKGEDKLEINL